MSWNVLQLQSHHQCHYPLMSHVEKWKGPTLKFLQLVLVCIEIWHGYIRHMPSCYGKVWRLEDTCRAHIIFEIIQVFINVHHIVSLWSFTIHINRIFVKTLLKCHGTSSYYNPITNSIIHQHHTLSSEMGQHWNCFNFCFYASKFDMVKKGTCLFGVGGF